MTACGGFVIARCVKCESNAKIPSLRGSLSEAKTTKQSIKWACESLTLGESKCDLLIHLSIIA